MQVFAIDVLDVTFIEMPLWVAKSPEKQEVPVTQGVPVGRYLFDFKGFAIVSDNDHMSTLAVRGGTVAGVLVNKQLAVYYRGIVRKKMKRSRPRQHFKDLLSRQEKAFPNSESDCPKKTIAGGTGRVGIP